MNEVIRLIRETLQLPHAEINQVKRLGGMTNINYLYAINGDEFIVRLPGNGTDQLINRSEEEKNLTLATSIGINPKHIYIDVRSGFKITEKIIGAETLTPEVAKERETMVAVASIFNKLHCEHIQMENRFELGKLMTRYEHLAEEANGYFFEGFSEVKEDVFHLKNYYNSLKVKESACHVDPSFTNFVFDHEKKLYLIDWEYSGMFDPLWDIAAFVVESKFTKAEETAFIKEYFKRDVTPIELERIHLHKIFQDYLWTVWSIFKKAKGDKIGTYGENRFKRAKNLISTFKKIQLQ